ncbi:MAG: nucleotidyl transferase AbiEii/AbiGii toxin family protein [Candidatus Hydrogenedentes bacterium]|nr:nucleotidyl transferase AbiEii/AbiGii toxin family protein [Candidatus Hydrogenedentota bacterium]
MPEFLRLKPDEQADILSAVSTRSGRTSHVLQKDIWVCWVLKNIFEKDTDIRMAFKGGTSLSKVFGLIHRFSEDVDVTLDYRDLMPDIDPFATNVSKSRIKRLGEALKGRVQSHIRDTILPGLSLSFKELTGESGHIELGEDGEKIWLYYPSSLGRASGYIQDTVLIEFGGRNVTEPNGPHTISPFLAGEIPHLDFPQSEVMVLAPERTFWEKATLIHVECNRKRTRRPDRLSRHWYDLAMIGQAESGANAISNRALLEDVVTHKQLFFNASYAHYNACLTGKFQLVPNNPLLSDLKRDYKQMHNAGMFDIEPPAFTEIVELLSEFEDRINGA